MIIPARELTYSGIFNGEFYLESDSFCFFFRRRELGSVGSVEVDDDHLLSLRDLREFLDWRPSPALFILLHLHFQLETNFCDCGGLLAKKVTVLHRELTKKYCTGS